MDTGQKSKGPRAAPFTYQEVSGTACAIPGTPEFYKTKRWQRKRAYILRLNGYRCQDCRKYGRLTEATEVHHIKHADEYPDLAFADDNLVALCHECHNKRHPEKAKALRDRGRFSRKND